MASTSLTIKFLGTGANGGVPQLDCRCRNCSNGIRRTRSSLLIEFKKKRLLIECGPDIKEQLESRNLKLQDLTAIAISHLHWDHSIGLVELSSGKKLQIPIIVPKILKYSLKSHQTFGFFFRNGCAKFSDGVDVNFGIKFIRITHDPIFPTFSILIKANSKSILYSSDIARISNKFIEKAKNADLIIFDGTFLEKSAHWHIAIKESAPILAGLNRPVIFTHINHSEDSKKIERFLEKFAFRLAFDGMKVKI